MSISYIYFQWFTLDWWKYLLEKPRSFRAFFCRARGHSSGVIYYNPYGLEPDMHCKNCGDDLG